MIRLDKIKKHHNSIVFSIPRFDNLTQAISGIRENELITISARVGCGKTTLALNLFTELSNKNKCWYISYEMNTQELINKISQFCSTPNGRNMYFDDSCDAFDIDYIRAMVKKHKIKFIFIDYLQLMGGHIKKNTRALKELCREQNVIVFMLAQLNRKAENKEPMLSMLKDSGTIEQDSDEVWFIKEHSIKVAKNRKASVGEIDIVFDKENSYFYENSDFRENKEKLKKEFLQLCCDYIDEPKIKTKVLMNWYFIIRNFLTNIVLPFDEDLCNEMSKIFIDVIDTKTKLINESGGNNTMVWIENIKLL